MQFNALNKGHLTNTFFCPIGVWIREVLLLKLSAKILEMN